MPYSGPTKFTHTSSELHREELTSGIQQLWNDKLLFDFTLIAEGEYVPVHKVVMAACSTYFRALFCGDMMESKENHVELKGISAEGLKSVIKFAYTGELDLCMENVEDVVCASSYFQMSQAERLCIEFLEMKITKENCVDVLNLAENFALSDAKDNIKKFMQRHFYSLSKDVVCKLSGKQLAGLIGSNSLYVNSEYQLFEMILLWSKENSEVSEDIMFDVFNKIRFALMSGEELQRVGQEKVMSSPQCQGLLSEALEYQRDVLRQPFMQSDRTEVRNDVKSFILAANDTIYHINQETAANDCCQLRRIPAFDSSGHVSLDHMVVVGNYLYACHTLWCDNSYRYFHRYDPRFDHWLKLPNMTMHRGYLVLVSYKRYIYAIGITEDGDGSEGMMEIFSIDENKWMVGLSCAVNPNFAAVTFDDSIYVSGGDLWSGQRVDKVSCYNVSMNIWESKTPMNHPRSSHEMVEYKGIIYVIGGSGVGSIEYYLQDVDQWTTCARSIAFGVFGVVVDEHIYLLRFEKTSDDDEGQLDIYQETDKISVEKYVPKTSTACTTFVKHMVIDDDSKIACARYGVTFKLKAKMQLTE